MTTIEITHDDITDSQTLYDLNGHDIFAIVAKKLNIDDIAELVYETDFTLTYTMDSIIFRCDSEIETQ